MLLSNQQSASAQFLVSYLIIILIYNYVEVYRNLMFSLSNNLARHWWWAKKCSFLFGKIQEKWTLEKERLSRCRLLVTVAFYLDVSWCYTLHFWTLFSIYFKFHINPKYCNYFININFFFFGLFSAMQRQTAGLHLLFCYQFVFNPGVVSPRNINS